MDLDWAIIGGLASGGLAGFGARYGRVCSMSAIEDALMGRDTRGAKAWGLSIGIAGLATMALVAAGLVHLSAAAVTGPRLHLPGVLLGGALFGLGMSLAGTCSFGLLVRAGSGDLRALLTALVAGIFAFAVTTGALAPGREWLLGFGQIDFARPGGATLLAWVSASAGTGIANAVGAAIFVALIAIAAADARVRGRRSLFLGASILGLAVAAGWLATSIAVAEMTATRIESLSFVAPAGRALLQFMTLSFRGLEFGVSAVLGVIVASFAVSAARRELRWEAFDDPREMRRHLAGGALMGIGGVLAQGCTIGQGLSAASTLAWSAPLFIIAAVLAAYTGIRVLIDGPWMIVRRFSTRAD